MGIHVLTREQGIDRPASEVFHFFASAENLTRVTPPKMGFEFRQPPPEHFSIGAEITYRVRLGGILISWTSRITEREPPRRFADTQVRGPYRLWNHTHFFDAIDDSPKWGAGREALGFSRGEAEPRRRRQSEG